MIWLHLTTVLVALGLGTANLVLVKGTPRHKTVGWVWMSAMLCVTLSSFAIRELNDGKFSTGSRFGRCSACLRQSSRFDGVG